MLNKFVLPALLAGAMFLILSPTAALAQNRGHDGGHSSGGGHSYAGRGDSGRAYNGSGQNYSRGGSYNRGAQNFSRGGGSYYRGGGYDRGRGYGGARGYSYGIYGAPYAYGPEYYAPGYCDPAAGYYDRWGRWHAACAAPYNSYGY